ncbi:hypothetical protein SAMN05446935_0351 [Burkholderia sp. YR290]|nr:hypothetical protein SAMN05446935_0351 [Burkholderia sp. YR290]
MNAYLDLAAKYTGLQAENNALRAGYAAHEELLIAEVKRQYERYVEGLAAHHQAAIARYNRATAAAGENYRARATRAEQELANLRKSFLISAENSLENNENLEKG